MTDESKYYKIEGDKLVRIRRSCPKCGPSFFLAEHYDRWTCGRCHYTVFKKKGEKVVAEAGPRGATRRSPRRRTKSR